MKKSTDPHAAGAYSEADDKSPRRRTAQVGSRTSTGAPATGHPSGQRTVTVRLPDLTPPTDHDDSESIDDELDYEDDVSRPAPRHEQATRPAAPAKSVHSPKQQVQASRPTGQVRRPAARPEGRPERDTQRKSSSSEDEGVRRERSERTGQRRRRESAPPNAKSKGKAKVGAGPLLIGMGLVGLILAGYAAVQKNQPKTASSDSSSGKATESPWQAKDDGEFTAPTVDLPGEAISPEEFAHSRSQPSADSFGADGSDSQAGVGADHREDWRAGAAEDAGDPEFDVARRDQEYDRSVGRSRTAQDTYEPGSTNRDQAWRDTPVVQYGRVGGASNTRSNDELASDADSLDEEAVSEVRGASYPSTDPSTYRLPSGQQPRDDYRVGRRESFETDGYGAGSEAVNDRAESQGAYGPAAGEPSRPQSYDARRPAPGPYEVPGDNDSTGYSGARAYDPRETGPSATDGAEAASPSGGGSRTSSGYGGQAYGEQSYGEAPAYESASRPDANAQPGNARLQGGIQPSYNGSRYERPGSRLY